MRDAIICGLLVLAVGIVLATTIYSHGPTLLGVIAALIPTRLAGMLDS